MQGIDIHQTSYPPGWSLSPRGAAVGKQVKGTSCQDCWYPHQYTDATKKKGREAETESLSASYM